MEVRSPEGLQERHALNASLMHPAFGAQTDKWLSLDTSKRYIRACMHDPHSAKTEHQHFENR